MPIQVVTWRSVVRGATPVMAAQPRTVDARESYKGTRSVRFPELRARVDCPVYARQAMQPGTVLDGPVLIEEAECTLVVGPHATVTVDASRMLRIALRPVGNVVAENDRVLAGAGA